MANDPLPPGSDAVDFANSATAESGPPDVYQPYDNFDNDEDTEDPTGKGKKKIHVASVFSWKPPVSPIPKRNVRGGNRGPSTNIRLTPGAKCLDVNPPPKMKER